MIQEASPKRRETLGRRRLAALAAIILALAFSGAGYIVRDIELIPRAMAKLQPLAARFFTPSVARAERSEIGATFHTLSMSRYALGQAWMLEEIEGRLLFSSRHGHFGYVQGDRVVNLHLVAPLGIENLSVNEDTINPDHVRVTDLLVLPESEGRHRLYVAHMIYSPECIRMAVSLTTISASAEALSADAGWSRVFSTRECLPQRASGFRYVGNQSGGRLVQLNATTLALSTGDFEFVGAGGEPSVSDDPNSEFGKILAISLRDGSARVLASGLRNPQGLLLSRSGDLWETEHGPRGGDELNLILPGRDYGWPNVTLGAPYGATFSPSWPPGATPGAHAGYERPRYAFLPSIGISNLVEPSTDEFPDWRDTLLVSSLAGSSLHLLRVEDGIVISAERIALPDMRVRDIISLSDGRIALATDAGDLVTIENAEHERAPVVALDGVRQLDQLPAFDVGPARQAQDGERLFTAHCASCHALGGPAGPGPSLANIIGARVGSAPDYRYSAALSGRNERWTEARLQRFLRDVNGAYPGTAMPQPSADLDRRSIVRFLSARQRAQAGEAREPPS